MSAASAKTGFARLGPKLYYEIQGEGHPLVLIYSGFLNSRIWDRQFNIFAKSYKVVRYDVRGSGRSDKPIVPYSDLDDLFVLLETLDIQRTYIVGLSDGGRIAIEFSLEHPEMVDGLVLVASSISGYEISSDPNERKAWNAVLPKLISVHTAIKEGRVSEAVERYLDLWAITQDEKTRQAMLKIGFENAGNFIRAPKLRLRNPALHRLSEISAPTLIVQGNRDLPTQNFFAERLKRQITGASKVSIPGGDHFVNMSKPEEFNKLVLEFLKSLDGARRVAKPEESSIFVSANN